MFIQERRLAHGIQHILQHQNKQSHRKPALPRDVPVSHGTPRGTFSGWGRDLSTSVHFCRQRYRGQGGHLPTLSFSSASPPHKFPTFREEAKPLKLISSFNKESGFLPRAEPRHAGGSNETENWELSY